MLLGALLFINSLIRDCLAEQSYSPQTQAQLPLTPKDAETSLPHKRRHFFNTDKIITVSKGALAPLANLKQDHSCGSSMVYTQLCLAAGDI